MLKWTFAFVLVGGISAQAPANPVTVTASLRGGPSDYPQLPPEVEAAEIMPNAGSYFYIENACLSDTSSIDKSRFANKNAFYKQAYLDAVEIADQAQAWPMYHTEASDLSSKLEHRILRVENIATK
jgi:hypothetical protein